MNRSTRLSSLNMRTTIDMVNTKQRTAGQMQLSLKGICRSRLYRRLLLEWQE